MLAMNAVRNDKGPRTQRARQGRAVSMTGAAPHPVGIESWLKVKLELPEEWLSSRHRPVQLRQHAPVGWDSGEGYHFHITMGGKREKAQENKHF